MGDHNTLLSTKEAAQLLNLRPQTLNCWRSGGGPLPFVRIGSRAIRYRRSDLEQFIAAGLCGSTSDNPTAA